MLYTPYRFILPSQSRFRYGRSLRNFPARFPDMWHMGVQDFDFSLLVPDEHHMTTLQMTDWRERPFWFWLAFPAVTMSLGWGLRGYIGGGPLGAMIPGALVGLALCLLLDREVDAGTVVAFAAIGVGFGGQETYGQTVGLSFKPETFAWAMLGFAIKGGVWGLLGGAAMGAALLRERYRLRDLLFALLAMVVATWAGWKLINEPKLIYFSNPFDKPRPEIWAGLLLGGLAFLAWLHYRGGARTPAYLAMWGTLGGMVGFPAGAALQVLGHSYEIPLQLGWWKVMELTFGACLGLGYGYAAWHCRKELATAEAPAARTPAIWHHVIYAAFAIMCAMITYPALSTRFGYTIAGAVLLGLVLFREALGWQAAITVTCCAFAYDFAKNKPMLPPPLLWVFVAVLTVVVAVWVVMRPRLRPMFVLLTWMSVGVSLLKSYLPLNWGKHEMMEAIFVLMGVVITVWARRTAKVPQPDTGSDPPALA
ncbi:MAG: hypothetical protein NTY38_02845 [Acidobacteria bacterium]|nr:hypothetical protein [Acidobacteriota bacterium]